ncbi:MAG: M20 family metallopeptidase [Acidimicrobiales bacterium]
MDASEAKQVAASVIESHRELLLEVSHSIHAHPEENYQEHFAHDVLTAALEAQGFPVTRGAFEMPTAFQATAGSFGPRIAVFCEYDALPGIGHACGHNIIAAAGLGAALGAAAVADALGGRLIVLGSPAEEGGGGKVHMIDRGALVDVDAAMMIHPADVDLRWMTTIAVQQLKVSWSGEAAHAAAHPWDGRNALDAAVLGYMNVAALRQHIRPDERLHGIFTNGGEKPNIVPSTAAMHWFVRAGNLERLQDLKVRVLAALTAGAIATGCSVEHEWIEPAYADLVRNDPFEALYAANSAALGREVDQPGESGVVVGSTDMGNVSHRVPSIHPMVSVAPRGVGIHTSGFADYARSPAGDLGALDGAKAMAMTIIDLWTSPNALQDVTEAFVSGTR